MLKNGHSEHSLESLRAPGTVFRIGRIEGSDLRLEHHAFPLLVSRNHAELFIEDGRLMLKNLNPLNGTYLSGRKLEVGEATPVTEGQIISFGGPKAIYTADSQHLQCSNPHTYAVVGLQGLLPTSPALDSFGSTQQLEEPPADTFEAPVLPEEAAVHTSEHAGEAQEAPASRPETHPAGEWVPARHLLEDTSPQEHVQQPDAVGAAPQPPALEASAPVTEARAYSPEPAARHLLDTSPEAEGQEPDAVAHQPPASEARAALQHSLTAPLQLAGIWLSAGDGRILSPESRAAAAAESTTADGSDAQEAQAPSHQSRGMAPAAARNILNASPEGQGQQPDASTAAEPAADASAAAPPGLPASVQPTGVWVSARDGCILSAEGAAAQQPAAGASATAQPVLAASKQQHAAQAVGSNLASPAARQEQPSPYRAVTGIAAELQNSIIDLTEGNDDDDDDDDIDLVGDSPPLPPPLPAENAAQTPQNAQSRPCPCRVKRASQAIQLDDDDVEILHNSQPAAASAAPRKAALSSAAGAAKTPGAASNQGDWLKDVEDEFSCAVCQESIIAAHSLVPCGHCFCGNCLFQWLSRKQICPTCRQPLEAPPVRSTGMDNILEKTEKHMTPAEVEDRAQRKLKWQAFADEAATSWKAMFPQAKRQRGADRNPPRHPIDIYLVSSGVMSISIMQGRGNEVLLPHAYALLEDLQAASQQRMQRRRRGVQRSPQAAARGRSEAEPQYYPPAPPPYARHRPHVPSLQPSDLVGGAPMHTVRQHQQPPQGSAGLRVEYPQPSGQPNHCLACRRGFQAGVPRLSSGNSDPIAWHLDCYQLWPMLATSRTSITGISRMTPTHQADILRRLGNHR